MPYSLPILKHSIHTLMLKDTLTVFFVEVMYELEDLTDSLLGEGRPFHHPLAGHGCPAQLLDEWCQLPSPA